MGCRNLLVVAFFLIFALRLQAGQLAIHPVDEIPGSATPGPDLPEEPEPNNLFPPDEVRPGFSHAPPASSFQSSAAAPTSIESEPYHWKGLLLQSFAFLMLEHGPRVLTANSKDLHILLNKPFWSDYWASLHQFNMGRWNDGDSFMVNYVGHPMQGAISGYLEVQNDPRGRSLQFSRDRRYWKSRFRAFLWSTAYSTQFEIGPISETSIFDQGGYTYPLGCHGNDVACEKTAKYTNNTGWVDFIITPVVGSMLLVGEDAMDRYISDPLVARHPDAFGYKVLRSSLNPSRSLANMLRGRYPWYRDYEHPLEYQSPVVVRFQNALAAEPHETFDVNLFYSALSLRTNHTYCTGCRETTSGGGAEVALRARRYLDVISVVRLQPAASPVSTLNIGGALTTAHFGLRSGYSSRRYALKASLAAGFASYSRANPQFPAAPADSHLQRNFNFSALTGLSGDVRFGPHFAMRATAEQMLIRYKSPDRDPPGIGTPPRLSFLSHDNYINSTNWGVRVGPVFRF